MRCGRTIYVWATLAVVAMLTGCGGESTTTAVQPSESTTTQTATTEAVEPAKPEVATTPAEAFAVGRRICKTMGRDVLAQIVGEADTVDIAIAYGKEIYEGPHAEDAAKGCLVALGG